MGPCTDIQQLGAHLACQFAEGAGLQQQEHTWSVLVRKFR